MVKKSEGEYIIYIDTGGTFSDAFILKPDGTFASGKVPTTPHDLSEGFMSCIEAGAAQMGKSLDEVLGNTVVIGYGTTQGTNIVVTGTGASRLGLITTAGHEDRTLIMRLRAAGLSRKDAMRMPRADKPAPLILRRRIRGVTERIDCRGQVYIPLREEEVRQAVKELLAEEVEGIAVALLWSFLNPAHERRVAEIIQEIVPGMPVSLSSTVAPLVREYTRTNTAIIDLYIGRALKELLEKIGAQVKQHGYRYPLLIMQATGGLARSDIVKPVTTLHSGPVGGFAGVEFLKKVYGFDHAMGCDPGGTSFDVCVSPKGRSEYLREPIVGRWEISNPMRDITTIGAGGGTMARVDPITGNLIVGPESAGAHPGPVCYMRGGKVPTSTDADVVMYRINPDYFLGGRMKLNRDAAVKAIKEKIADPLKMDVADAAEGICKVLDATMSATLRSTLAIKGADVSQYALFVYGGAGPSHCAGFTAGLHFKEIVIPPFASVFCAFGASTADILHRYEASPFVSIRGMPYEYTTLCFNFEGIKSLDDLRHEGIDRFNRIMAELEARARVDMEAEGLKKEQVRFNYEMLARYGGQLWELRVRIPVSRLNSLPDLVALARAFEQRYYEEYGLQAMAPRGGIQIVTIAVELVGATRKPQLIEYKEGGKNPKQALKEEREVYFNGAWRKSRIYEMSRLRTGNEIYGPAIIEGVDTTVVIPEDRWVLVDKYRNMLMRYR